MNLQELEIIKAPNIEGGVIRYEGLTDKTERTLLYGYTCDRSTFHVYIKDKKIRIAVYGYNEEPWEITPTTNFSYVPDKRVYPEDADFEFCSLLKQDDVRILFTSYSEERAARLDNNNDKYSGELL